MEITNKYILITLFAFVIISKSHAQSSYLINKRLIFNLHNAFILKNKTETAHLSDQRPTGLEIELNRQTKGEKLWHSLYKYPETGVSVQYWIMDPEKRLGNQLGIVFYAQKHLFQNKKFSLLYRIGAGPGYIEKRFNLFTNNENNLISSRINFVLNGRLVFKYRINQNLSLNTGLGIVHFSNGGFKMPNQGINIPSIHVGLVYHFKETESILHALPSKINRSYILNTTLAFGSKNDYPVRSKNYMVSTLLIHGGRVLNYKSTIITGVDLFYDGTLKPLRDTLRLEKPTDLFKIGIAAGHELSFGKTDLIIHFGYLVYDPAKLLSSVYQRYGLRIKLSNNISTMVAMKAHLGRADFVEWSIGYTFKKKPD